MLTNQPWISYLALPMNYQADILYRVWRDKLLLDSIIVSSWILNNMDLWKLWFIRILKISLSLCTSKLCKQERNCDFEIFYLNTNSDMLICQFRIKAIEDRVSENLYRSDFRDWIIFSIIENYKNCRHQIYILIW